MNLTGCDCPLSALEGRRHGDVIEYRCVFCDATATRQLPNDDYLAHRQHCVHVKAALDR